MVNLHGNRKLVLVSVLTTISSIHPASLTGALGLILRDELRISETTFGFLASLFFLGAAVSSIFTPKLVEKFGAKSAITAGLSSTILVDVIIVLAGLSTEIFGLALFAAGAANSANQVAVNKLLSDKMQSDRLASSISIKQSGMPTAAMLAGIAVPAIALTYTWQVAYVLGAVFTATTIFLVRRIAPSQKIVPKGQSLGELHSSKSALWFMALGGVLAAGSAGAGVNWLTSAAEAAGFGKDISGLMLSAGSLLAIGMRLATGFVVDAKPNINVTKLAASYLALGSFGALILTQQSTSTYLVGVLLAIGLGWSWPALFSFAVIKANPKGVARATGITQLGIYVGVLSGPTGMGIIIDSYGYSTAWMYPFIMMFAASGMVLWAGSRL